MPAIARPQYLNRLIRKMNNGMIKVITEVRRSGKSYLLFELFYRYLQAQGIAEDAIVRLALDDAGSAQYLDPDRLYRFLADRTADSTKHCYVLIDEVQFVITREELKNRDAYVQLYGILNGLLHKRNVDVYVTGSSSKLLTADVLKDHRGQFAYAFVEKRTGRDRHEHL